MWTDSPTTRRRKNGVLSQLPTVISGSFPSHSGRGFCSAEKAVPHATNNTNQMSCLFMTPPVYVTQGRNRYRIEQGPLARRLRWPDGRPKIRRSYVNQVL